MRQVVEELTLLLLCPDAEHASPRCHATIPNAQPAPQRPPSRHGDQDRIDGIGVFPNRSEALLECRDNHRGRPRLHAPQGTPRQPHLPVLKRAPEKQFADAPGRIPRSVNLDDVPMPSGERAAHAGVLECGDGRGELDAHHR